MYQESKTKVVCGKRKNGGKKDRKIQGMMFKSKDRGETFHIGA